ncbi:hypothetical protein J3R83DRAFT_1847, partial [Lanmaoa asiatica]
PKHCVPFLPPDRSVVKTTDNLLPQGFTFFSSFFDVREQRLLLTTALSQLDATESIRVRRLQNDFRARNPVSDSASVEGVFLPDRYYTFHEVSMYTVQGSSVFDCSFSKGHYDNVIRDYREMRLPSWPESEPRGLTPVFDRLRALYPSKDTQTHLLHLASSGEILPHVDNASASGEWILGVSLGATRTLRMESPSPTESESFDLVLPSGSVYLQRDDIRYRWKHAILPSTGKEKARCGQRISIMIRVC